MTGKEQRRQTDGEMTGKINCVWVKSEGLRESTNNGSWG